MHYYIHQVVTVLCASEQPHSQDTERLRLTVNDVLCVVLWLVSSRSRAIGRSHCVDADVLSSLSSLWHMQLLSIWNVACVTEELNF